MGARLVALDSGLGLCHSFVIRHLSFVIWLSSSRSSGERTPAARAHRPTSILVTILDTIVEEKKREIERLPQRAVSVADLRTALQARGGLRDFAGALSRAKEGSIALIAEIKKASPSAGVICPDFDPVRIAREYETAGASCLSVLTDEKFFQGSLEYLKRVRRAVGLPLLRKDFIIDKRQILQAVEWGADAILLIVAILSDAQLQRLHELATGAGLAALVEVHDEAELDRTLALGAELIGINNRNLKTFKVDLATTERLAARARSARKPDRRPALLVAESGIHTRADVERLAKCGARAMLVGESLMRHGDIGAKIRELLAC
jgi:indole-3-glycerol phosphate synthase